MLEYWLVPNNPAIEKARSIYNKFAIKRNETEMFAMEKKWPKLLQCCKCTKNGNKKKYNRDELLHMPSRTYNKGRKVVYWRHYCRKCQKKYKPYTKIII